MHETSIVVYYADVSNGSRERLSHLVNFTDPHFRNYRISSFRSFVTKIKLWFAVVFRAAKFIAMSLKEKFLNAVDFF